MMRYSRINNITGWVVFAIALVTFTMTMEATASFWDCGEFIAATYKLQVVHPPGAPIFLMIGRIFSLFASSPEHVPTMTNFFSALSSAFAVLFAFWIITRLVRRNMAKDEEMTGAQIFMIMGSGIIGALALTWMDSFWFSAVESEVYALATFFFVIIFWCIVKWEEHADSPDSDRWILFAALLMGLSIGVHLLALLVVPAICLIYYFRNYTYSHRGFWYTIIIGVLIVAVILYGMLDYFIGIGAVLDRIFVNGIGLPFGSGLLIYGILIVGGLIYGVRRAIQRSQRSMYLVLMSTIMLLIGLSSYAMVTIRAKADPVINMNGINDVHTFLSYLKREQYGSRAIFYGPFWTAQPFSYEQGKAKYGIVGDSKKYEVVSHEFKPVYSFPSEYQSYANDPKYRTDIERNKKVLFPRMGSPEDRHAGLYYQWVDVPEGQEDSYIPTYADNLNFFFNYQLGHMFWRYFMWNFSGRQNDSQGNFYDGYKDGNWITGIQTIDKSKNPQLDHQPAEFTDVVSHNVFYMLPFIIGIIGMVYQLRRDWRGFLVILIFFVFMGFMNIFNMNQPPTEPRERDYAQVGAFFAFTLWIGMGVAGLVDLARSFTADTIKKYLLYAGFIILGMFLTGLTMYHVTTLLYVMLYTGLFMLIAAFLVNILSSKGKNAMVMSIVAFVICLPAPLLMGAQGWDDHDRSDRTFARDIARNYLESCPPHAILFTQGDNDTYPLWYAQEVEGIRTDVKIINLSLLGVDWYINQLRHATNDSPPIKLSLTPDKIMGDKRNQIVKNEKSKFLNQTFELSDFVKFIGTDDPKIQIYSEVLKDYLSYSPTQNLKITIDSAAMISNGIVPEDLVPDIQNVLTFRLRNAGLLKNDLMTLDIVANNINDRPICFAISVTPDSHLGMEKYLMHRNMVYQLMPVEMENSKSVMDGFEKDMNTDIQYDLLVNQKDKFTYGGVERGKRMYVDPSAMGSVLTAKYLNYFELVKSLNSERTYLEAQAKQMMKDTVNQEYDEVGKQLMDESNEKKQKALEVLDLMMQLFPDETLPYDYNMASVAQLYQQLGNNDKAREIIDLISERAFNDLDYFYRMTQESNFLGSMFKSDRYSAETCVYYSIDMYKKIGDKDTADSLQARWEGLQVKYGIVNQNGKK
ncbi:MAG: DUF2723 domain-containing protein [Chitinophagales bacterium]